jgi:hypothetical protein
MIVEKTINVNKKMKDVFEMLYENNAGIFDKHMKIMKWEKQEWKLTKNMRQRKEYIYIYIETIPDEVVKYIKENDKYLYLETKNKMIVDTPTYQKIKTKFKILNVNPFLKTVLNDLRIVNMKNVIELTRIDDNSTRVKIAIKVQLMIPKTRTVDNFMSTFSNNLLDSAISSFDKSI